MAMPDEVKEARMNDMGKPVSRQTIARYISVLNRKGYISTLATDFTDYIYYFAYKKTQRIVEREEYSTAWREYWAKKESGWDSFSCIMAMRAKYGGVARKQAIPGINAFYLHDIDVLCSLIQESIEKELEKSN